MSDQYYYQPQPGDGSAPATGQGAYMQNPQQPSYYYQDANQLGMANAQYAPAAPQQAVQTTDTSALSSWFAVNQPDYLKGLLVGAGVALVVSNPTVQKAVVSGAIKVWAAVQGGVEELKEQIQDAKAELSHEE